MVQTTEMAADDASVTGRRAAGRTGDRASRRRPTSPREGATALRLRCLLALGLVTFLPLIVVLVLAAMLALTVVAFGTNVVLGTLLALATAWVLLLAVEGVRNVRTARAATRREPENAVLLTRATHAQLWRTVGEISRGMDVPEPDRVFVTDSAEVAVALRGRNRDLEIGLPLLGVLEVDELSALVAHELGHDIRASTGLLARTHRTTRRVDAVMVAVPPGLVKNLLERWLRLVANLARPANTLQELQADEWAAQLLGPRPTASALQEAVTVETAWYVLGEEYLPMVRRAQRRPPLIEGLQSLIAERGVDLGRDSRRRVRRVSPFDAHPARADRIQALLELAGADTDARPPAPAAHLLLTGGEDTLDELERRLVPDRPRRPRGEVAWPAASWEEVVALAGRGEQERRLRILVGAATEAGIGAGPQGEPALPDLLRAAAEGRLEPLELPPLDPRIRTERRRDGRLSLVRGYLAAMVTVAMIRSGRARHDLDWDGPPELLRRDDDGQWLSWDPAPTIAQGVATPLSVDALLRWLTHLGADLRTPLRDDDTRAGRDVRALGALTRMRYTDGGRTASATLVVYTTGLLVAPAPAPTGLLRLVPRRLRRLLPAPNTAGDPVAELTRLAEDDPETCPGAVWIPSDAVTRAQLQDLRAGLSVEVTTGNGHSLTLASGRHTERQGNPAEDLTRLLGDRLRVVH